MNRRFATSPTKSPALTGGDDRPAPACEGHLELVEGVYARGAAAAYAYPRLMALCEGCPLRPECWADKEWREALKGAVA